jgi:hypothetical protein
MAASCFLSNLAGRTGREGLAAGRAAARLEADELDLTVGLDAAPRADVRPAVFLAVVLVDFAVFFAAVFLAAPVREEAFFLAAVFFKVCFDAAFLAPLFLANDFLVALFEEAFFGAEGFLAAVMGVGR